MSGVTMKTCSRCNEVKPLGQFSMDRAKKDGLQTWCKQCTKDRFRLWKANNELRYITLVREWAKNNKDRQKENYERWVSQHEDYVKAYDKNRSPEKCKAHRAVRRAVMSGDLQRSPCEVCGHQYTEGHHYDYSKENWLNVNWLCPSHHSRLHGDLQDHIQLTQLWIELQRARFIDGVEDAIFTVKDGRLVQRGSE